MSRYVVATRAECEAVQAHVSKLHGYPREGVDIGRGRHTKHDRVNGVGWTLHAYGVEVELDDKGEPVKDGRIFTAIDDPDAAGDKASLTVAELEYLRTKWADADDATPVTIDIRG